MIRGLEELSNIEEFFQNIYTFFFWLFTDVLGLWTYNIGFDSCMGFNV